MPDNPATHGDSDADDADRSASVLLAEQPPHLLFGLLLVAFTASTLQVLLSTGDRSVAGWTRLVLGVVGGGAVVVNWWFEVRHPASIEVTGDRVRWSRRDRSTVKELVESQDPIHVYTVGRGRRPKALVRDGDAAEVPLDRFDTRAVLRACRSAGWTIGPPVHGRSKLQSADLFH